MALSCLRGTAAPELGLPSKSVSTLPRFFLMASLLAVGAGISTGQVLPEWSNVQGIEPGRRITVRLFRDAAGANPRVRRGRFASATLSSVTFLAESGSSVTLPQTIIRRVEIRRPFTKRPGAWGLTALIAVPLNLLMGWQDSVEEARSVWAWSIPLTVGLIWPVATMGLPMKSVYSIPPRVRDEYLYL